MFEPQRFESFASFVRWLILKGFLLSEVKGVGLLTLEIGTLMNYFHAFAFVLE